MVDEGKKLRASKGPVDGSQISNDAKLSKKKRRDCPDCGHSREVIPIIYGEPTGETMKKAEAGLVWLGGCVLTNVSPRYHCKKHDIDF